MKAVGDFAYSFGPSEHNSNDVSGTKVKGMDEVKGKCKCEGGGPSEAEEGEGEGEIANQKEKEKLRIIQREEDDMLYFSYSKSITGTKVREIGDSTVFGNTLDFKWLPAYNSKDGKKYQSLIIGMSRVGDLSLSVLDDCTISCVFTMLNVDHSGRYEESQCAEYIHSEYAMVIGQEVSREIANRESGEFLPIKSTMQHNNDCEGSPAVGNPYCNPDGFHPQSVLPYEYLAMSRERRYNIRLNVSVL